MKFGVPWSVKGIRPEARETAKEAARRSGMPLGEWLNSVILQQAEQDGGDGFHDDEDAYGDEIASVHQRLDDISRKIEQFGRATAARAPQQQPRSGSHEPARIEARRESEQLAQLISRLDQRIDQFANIPRMMAAHAPPMAPVQPMAYPQHMPPAANLRPGFAPMPPQPVYPPKGAAQFAPPGAMPAQPGLERAVAEIAARRQALSAGKKPSAAPLTPDQFPPQVQAYAPPQQPYVPSPALTPLPSQDLSGLEQHLRQITDQIETLRRPGVEDAINALRGELGDIGRALNEAMPRQAIDAIERQIQGLTQRIAESRQSNAATDPGALSGVEHALAEVRDALRGLTPAENLVGFNDAVSGLAHKIDLIVAQKDPQTLGQLEHAITTLRDMAEHVASNEAVGTLAAQVRQLAEKVDHLSVSGGASDALNSLEHRIGALSDALAQRSQAGAVVPPRLEALVESLSDKIEQIQQSRGETVASGHLEDQIVALVQRLDASDSRLGHLEAIERGLADLLVHIEEMRAGKGASGPREDSSSGVIELKHDIARTQNALDAVHGTLGLVVDRLATIERDVRHGAQPAVQGQPRADQRAPLDLESMEIDRPVGRIAARAVVMPPDVPPQDLPPQPPQPPRDVQAFAPQAERPHGPTAFAAPAPQPAPKRPPAAARMPINPDLPPDQPIEPGSAPPRFQPNPSARIAASEAALGRPRPAPEAGPVGKSGFIAAARRAAQAALETATPRAKVRPEARPEPRPAVVATSSQSPVDIEDSERPTARRSIMKRVKSLLIAASIVAIVIGAVQIAGNVFNFGTPNTPKPQGLQNNLIPDVDTAADGGTSGTAPQPSPAGSQPVNPSLFSDKMTLPPPAATPITPRPPAAGPSTVNPAPEPAPGSQSALDGSRDITGSIGRPSAKPKAAAVQDTDPLPIAIGAARLRQAAAGGDAAAAYEIAVRFAEARGVPRDPEAAARWYERASSKGLAPAQFRYASLLEKGQGVKKNLSQARKLYLAAAGQGHAKAMHNLAVLYAEGIDGKPDYGTAASWFRKAAQYGVADSQYNLGVLCARGLGTDKSMDEAYMWFALAAAQGDREAAKKRDDVAAHMEPDALTTAQQSVKDFVAKTQPRDAIEVPVPHGGWDDATGANQPRQVKTQVGRALSANMPLDTTGTVRAVR